MSTRIVHRFRRLGSALVIFVGLVGFILTASPGFAIGPGSGPGGGGGKGGKGGGGIPPPPPGGGGGATPPAPIPEISPGSAASALLLLAGGTLILTDRLRRPVPPAHAST